MEQAADIDKRVLAVVSDKYLDRSNTPAGGVGYEKKVIAPTVMQDLASDRIVPILRNNTSKKLPKYMGASKYTDFTDDSQYEDRLLELVYELHGHPLLPKPPLGRSPFAEGVTEAQVRIAVRDQQSRYLSDETTDEVEFDYSDNSGTFTLGSGDHTFTFKVSESGHGSVYVYNDPANIQTVALARHAPTFAAIGDGADHDTSSRSRAVKAGDAAVLQNDKGYWAGLLIDEVLTRESNPAGHPSLRFRFRILLAKRSRFDEVE